jgi:cytochrome c
LLWWIRRWSKKHEMGGKGCGRCGGCAGLRTDCARSSVWGCRAPSGGGGRPQLLEHSAIPADVRKVLVTKCADCDSMGMHAPLYGRFAPISWLLERDIVGGRADESFAMGSYTPDEREAFATEIVQQTKKREMPLLQYRMIHWGSRITDGDVEVLKRMDAGCFSEHCALAGGGCEDSAARGKALFERRCMGCHALDVDREGPRPRTVYGRASGAVEDFSYSAALKKAQIVWDEQTLERWLADPMPLCPETTWTSLLRGRRSAKT